MALGIRRTEHAGYLTGSDGQKEYDNKRILKWASRRQRRQQARKALRSILEDAERDMGWGCADAQDC